MAAGITIYKLFRTIHHYSASLVVTFLLLYFVSGFILVKESLFRSKEIPVEKTLKELKIPAGLSEQQLVSLFREMLQVRGKYIRNIAQDDGGFRFEFVSPVARNFVVLPATGNEVQIEKHPLDFRGTMIIFHRYHEYGGGLIYDIYLIFMDLASLSLIVFAITGTYLWIRLMKNKKLGIILLMASFLYTLIMLLTFRYY